MLPFVIKNEKFLEKYHSIWNKIGNIIGIKFDKMQIYGRKYLNTTFKFCNSKINTDFYGKKKRNHSKNSNSTAIVLNSVCKIKNKDKQILLQISLEQCQYEETKAKKKTRLFKGKKGILYSGESEQSDQPIE